MIDELQVSNIALIREATLVPSAGLTVLTGETGAGKTALLSALKLILGERADSSTVREGEALAGQIRMDSIARLGAEAPHHVIFADIELLRQIIQRNIIPCVLVDIG